jgi:membrane-associated protease RseP (regulator of RpoE activity)
VLEVDLYPIFGITRFTTPWSRLDHCKIAWAGVLAQAAVFIPIVLWVHFFGYSHIDEVNMLFAILGFFSLGVALLNLLPVPPLDGSIAWGIIPTFLAARRTRVSRKPTYR